MSLFIMPPSVSPAPIIPRPLSSVTTRLEYAAALHNMAPVLVYLRRKRQPLPLHAEHDVVSEIRPSPLHELQIVQ